MERDLFYFDARLLDTLAQERTRSYVDADPFPHIVFDDFFPVQVLDEVLEEFPGTDDFAWNRFGDSTQNLKLSCEDESRIGPRTRHLLQVCNGSVFVSFLEKLTGIPGLIPDPHFRGGGLHQTLRGGHLGIHADFNKYKRLNLYRRLNLLVYLNKEWNDEWGGHLELWSRDGKTCVRKVAPKFNRAVLFSTAEDSYHGHPHPLAVPEGISRKSLALYYYTVARGENISERGHTTVFLSPRKKTARDIVRSLTPPILIEAARRLLRP